MRTRLHLIFLPILLLTSACATTMHNPMSEMVMFGEKVAYNNSTYNATYGHGFLSYGVEAYPAERANRYAAQEGDFSESSYGYDPGKSVTTNFLFLSENQDVGFSIALGAPIGVDFTIRAGEITYFTVSNSILDSWFGTEFIAQNVITRGISGGLSLGVSIQRKTLMVETPRQGCFFYCSEDFTTTSAGLRSVFLLSPPSSYGNSRFYIYGVLGVNYDFHVQAAYPRIGISFGLY